MLDLTAVQLALRANLLATVVATTGVTTLQAVAAGYRRSSGSFVDEGFSAGMEVTPSGFPETTASVIEAVSALELTIAGGRTAAASASGRSLTVGIPTLRAWENTHFEPDMARPHITEQMIPGTSSLIGIVGDGGMLDDAGGYQISWHVPAGSGIGALSRPADKVREQFKPRTSLPIAGGLFVRVLKQGPFRGSIRSEVPGRSSVVITVPWRVFSHND